MDTSPANPGKGLLYGANFENHSLVYLIKKTMAIINLWAPICVRTSLRAWALCCWWFVCLFHQMRTISSLPGSELLPNPEDQANLTTIIGEFWLVPESGLLTSVAPWRSASPSSLRKGHPTRCSAQGSLYLQKLQSSLFSVWRSPEHQSMCPLSKHLLIHLGM